MITYSSCESKNFSNRGLRCIFRAAVSTRVRRIFVMHYNDVKMSVVASQITSLTIVYSNVYLIRRSKKTSKLRVTGLCAGNSPVTGEFPTQRASSAENVSIWWRHHGYCHCHHSPISTEQLTIEYCCMQYGITITLCTLYIKNKSVISKSPFCAAIFNWVKLRYGRRYFQFAREYLPCLHGRGISPYIMQLLRLGPSCQRQPLD